jgi:cell division transport system ATP-binding protein
MIYLAEPISEGQIIVGGMNLSRIPRKKIPLIRREYGIIFQDFRLIPSKTVLENVSLVLEVKGNSGKAMQRKVKWILRTVGMENKLNAYPPTLSGGEQQRVAIARAVVGEPKIILADEPTGSLDHDSANIVMDLLEKFHSRGTTIIMATHDESLFNRVNGRVIRLQEGHLKTFSENEELMQ